MLRVGLTDPNVIAVLDDGVTDVLRRRDERDAGRTLQAIADDLNAENVPTARGGRWYPSTIAKVLNSVALDADAARLASQAVA